MATFEDFDVQNGDPASLVDALLVPDSGINIVPESVRFRGGIAQRFDLNSGEEITSASTSFYDGSIEELGIGAGILLTSGAGAPPESNTQPGFSATFTEGGTEADPDLQAVADAAFEGSGETRDVNFLEFKFTVDNVLDQRGIQLDLVFGSDEFPEFTDSEFVDVAGVFLNGQNIALFNQNENQPLSIISENLNVGNFRSNGTTGTTGDSPVVDVPLEYDGLSARIKIVAPVQPGENTLKIGIADTGDQILDSGLFVANLDTASTGGGGLLSEVPGTEGDDELTGGEANEFLNGGGGNDQLDPGGGNDVVAAGPGDDTIIGGSGDNNIDGGPGLDTAVFPGAQSAFPTVVLAGGALQVGTNTDVLTNVETLQFEDGTVAASDVRGKDLISKIYVGYFGRAPDPDGLAYWLGQLQQGEAAGESRQGVMDDIANSFAISEEANSLFPFLSADNPDPAQVESFVSAVFQNLFNRDADPAGLAFWRDQILGERAAGRPEGSIIMDIISGAQNTAEFLDATTIQNKARVALRYADEYELADVEWTVGDDLQEAQDIIADVTDDAASRESAEQQLVDIIGAQTQALTAGEVDAFA